MEPNPSRGTLTHLLKLTRRHVRLYRVFWENCFAREAEFRANFWAGVLTNAGWLFFFVVFIEIVYGNTRSIAGWTEAEALTLTGTFGLVQGLFSLTAYQNLARLPELIRLGTLDFVIIRPVNSQFFVSARYIKLDSVGNLVGALFVIGYGVSTSGSPVSAGGVGLYLLMVAAAFLIYYSVYMLLMTLSIWLVRLENLAVLADTMFHAARYPTEIFGRVARVIFTFVLPLAFLAAVPARCLFGKGDASLTAAGLAIAAVLLLVSSLFWRFALRHYSSASS